MADALTTEAKRSYTILGLVGEGGTGRVYRAHMVDGDFHKDVALKMLHAANPSDDHLARFRDEARILALFRDRAVVSVDPPVHLAGRWCVVMDFVEGHSAGHLLRKLGAFPPRVALEIVAEVARVLRNAYDFPGPRGAPLRLLHRDIKPGNIQVTRSGEVRILDFGSARATFENREADTQEEISGTPGYIAPERLEGIEGPAGDIYSLGITLWCMLTDENTVRRREDPEADAKAIAGTDGALAAALGLAVRMRERDADLRPSAEEVQSTARALASALPGPSLEDWCASMPPRPLEDDQMKGQRLTETLKLEASGSTGRTMAMSAGVGVGSLLALVAVGALGVGAGVLVILAALSRGGGSPAPEPGVAVAPEPMAMRHEVPAGMIGVHLRSTPEGADVAVDGKSVGQTPLLSWPVTPGTHTVTMTKGRFETERSFDVQKPGTLHWNIMQGNSRLEMLRE
ncbi:MAG: serine/threonine protein kinase [Myxococcales bacterium]|nr:serine/threonine protein kinase [Myxococcales bacterium]